MVWFLVAAGVLIVAACVLALSQPKPRIIPAAPDLSEVRRLVETGRTNSALELYRRLTGVDEAEAAVAIDRIARGHPPITPPPAAPSGDPG